MKILLAYSERDLLQGLTGLMKMDGHEVQSVFDGPQASALLARSETALLITEEALPGIRLEQLLDAAEEKRIPSVVITRHRVTVSHLLQRALPSAFLPLPFLPEDLRRTVADVSGRAAEARRIAVGPLSVDVQSFRFAGTSVRLTAGEIGLLEQLDRGDRVGGRAARTRIAALNEKFRLLGSPVRIEYEMEKGYRMVTGND